MIIINAKFLAALSFLLGVLTKAWELFTSSIPAIAITMILALLIISIVIDRLINPMIGKATNCAIDTAMYDTKRQLDKKENQQKIARARQRESEFYEARMKGRRH